MDSLLKLLESYTPTQGKESQDLEDILKLIQTHGQSCLYRDCFHPGHITASALVVSKDGRRVLMNHHKTLGKWLCFGGHADGESDVLNVAMREAREESGLTGLVAVEGKILDVDIHTIPENPARKEPQHKHHDISFLLQCEGSEDFTMSDESSALRWCGYDEAVTLGSAGNMKRLLDKWHYKG